MLGLLSVTSLKMHFIFKHWHEVEDKKLTKGSNLQSTEPSSIQLALRRKVNNLKLVH